VKKADLEAVRRACAAWQREQRRIRALLKGWPALKERFDRREWDPDDWMGLARDHNAALEQLIALAIGNIGKPMQQLRATAALGEVVEQQQAKREAARREEKTQLLRHAARQETATQGVGVLKEKIAQRLAALQAQREQRRGDAGR
jgi:hypothetical protein